MEPTPTFDLTPPVKQVPRCDGSSSPHLILADQDERNISAMRKLEQAIPTLKLHSGALSFTQWPTDLSKQVAAMSNPLRSVTGSALEQGYWELYAGQVIPGLQHRVQARAARSKARAPSRAVPSISIKSVHVMASDVGVRTLGRVLRRAEGELATLFPWDWIATNVSIDPAASARDPPRWVKAADSTMRLSLGNMRTWANKITTTLKAVDIIVVDIANEDDVVNSIVFALTNVAPGGDIIVHIPRLAAASTAAVIHYASMCFEQTQLVHIAVCDRMYMCCRRFLGGIGRGTRALFAYCESDPRQSDRVPFTSDYVDDDLFQTTVDQLMDVNIFVQQWRRTRYEQILDAHAGLIRTNAQLVGVITAYLADYFPDRSAEWIASTGYTSG
jgi:hypothetical protein